MSLLNPNYNCRVIDTSGRALNNVLLPGRPEVGDLFKMFGKDYRVVSSEVNWTGIVKTSIHQPDRIPCLVVVE